MISGQNYRSYTHSSTDCNDCNLTAQWDSNSLHGADDGGKALEIDLYFGICDSLDLRDWIAAIE